MSSATEAAGKSSRTVSVLGIEVMIASGSKADGSKLSFLYITTLVVSGAGCAASKV